MLREQLRQLFYNKILTHTTMLGMNSMRFIVLLLLLASVAPTRAQEWTRFRGPNGSGLGNATTIPLKWTADDYNWTVQLPGVAHSSPVLWGKRLFATSADDAAGIRHIQCFDVDTGMQLWIREIESKFYRKHKHNSYASATPALDDRRLITCWTEPDKFVVIALDHDGNNVWRQEFDPFRSGHGDGISPAIHDGVITIPLEHSGKSSLIGLDCDSGDLRWKVDRDSGGNWSTPCVLTRGETAEFIFTNWRTGISAIDAKTGKVNWQANVFDKGHTESSISSPIVAGDVVLGTSGWLGVRQEVIAVRPRTEANKVTAEQLFCIDKGAPLCVTPLVKGKLLFVWSDGGIVTCADVRTGDVHWRKRANGSFYSSPICVADRVYNITRDGEVVVLAADLEFRELARIPLGEPTHSTPAIAGGVMYIRTFTHLYAIGGNTN